MVKRKVFSTQTIAGMAIFTALSYLCYIIIPEIQIFPAAYFLELDFSNVFVMLAGFMYGGIPAIIVAVIKEILHVPYGGTVAAGELANMFMTSIYVIIPSIVYQRRKGIKTVIFTLLIACVLQTGISLPVNRYVTFPYFNKGIPFVVTQTSEEMFAEFWYYVLFFNAIKSVSISIITIILYKRVKFLFEKVGVPDLGRVKGSYTSESEDMTTFLAQKYARSLKKGDVVLLIGEMGAGKTAFMKGVAKYFGYDDVTSPTYAYLNVYGDYLYHYDCYRLSSGEDALNLGLTDYFNKDNICFIEWSENIKDVLPKKVKRVIIEKIGENKRKITL